MGNNYFEHLLNKVHDGSFARADQINNLADEIERGFDSLPDLSGVQRRAATFVVATGDANIYSATLTGKLKAYPLNMELLVQLPVANTGPSVLNLDGIGFVGIQLLDGSDLIAGDISTGMVAHLRFDGEFFQLLNPAPSTLTVSDGTTTVDRVRSITFDWLELRAQANSAGHAIVPKARNPIGGSGPTQTEITVITTAGAGTYVPPVGTVMLEILGVGGGGAGGGVDVDALMGFFYAGGGEGGRVAYLATTTVSASLAYTIGAGGVGGADGGAAGGETTIALIAGTDSFNITGGWGGDGYDSAGAKVAGAAPTGGLTRPINSAPNSEIVAWEDNMNAPDPDLQDPDNEEGFAMTSQWDPQDPAEFLAVAAGGGRAYPVCHARHVPFFVDGVADRHMLRPKEDFTFPAAWGTGGVGAIMDSRKRGAGWIGNATGGDGEPGALIIRAHY